MTGKQRRCSDCGASGDQPHSDSCKNNPKNWPEGPTKK